MPINYDRVRCEFAEHNAGAYEALISEIRSVVGNGKLSRKEMVSRINSLFNAMEEGKRICASKFDVEV